MHSCRMHSYRMDQIKCLSVVSVAIVRMRCNTRKKEILILKPMHDDAYSCRKNTEGFVALSSGFHAYTSKLIFGMQKKSSSEQSIFTRGVLILNQRTIPNILSSALRLIIL